MCCTRSNLSSVLSLATRETWFLWICALNRTGERERDSAVWATKTRSQLALINSPTNQCRSIHTEQRQPKKVRNKVRRALAREKIYNTCRNIAMASCYILMALTYFLRDFLAQWKSKGFAFFVVDVYCTVCFFCLSISYPPPLSLLCLSWHVKGATGLSGLITWRKKIKWSWKDGCSRGSQHP